MTEGKVHGVVAGNIGGTGFRLCSGRYRPGEVTLLRGRRDKTQEVPCPITRVGDFVAGVGEDMDVDGVCLAGAGPVTNNVCSNIGSLPWLIDGNQARDATGKPVWVINDFLAAAEGIPLLGSTEKVAINGVLCDEQGTTVVAGPGTGHGQAALFWNGKELVAHACEGGHSPFAPRNDVEDRLREFLRRKLGRPGKSISVERVVSGPGVANLFEFVLTDFGLPGDHDLLQQMRDATDPSEFVTRSALAGLTEFAVDAMRLFIGIYAAECASLCMKYNARNLYLAGGIPPKIEPLFESMGFMDTLLDTDRCDLTPVSVTLIKSERLELLGCIRYAYRQLQAAAA